MSIKARIKQIIIKIFIGYYSFMIRLVSFFSKKKASAIAVGLIQKPRNGKLSKAQRDLLDSWENHSILSHGEEIATYHWQGDGPSVLLLHGWESSSVRWKPYIKEFQKRNISLYALDAPAHGLSGGKIFNPVIYADAVGEFCKKYKVDVILGHSVGAYATLLYASRLQRHQELKHIILLAPTGKIKNFMNRFFDAIKLSEAVRKEYFNEFRNINSKDIVEFDSEVLVKKIKLKGLLIHDRDDKTLPFEDSELIAQNWSEGKFIATDGYGHRLKSSFIYDIVFDYLDKELLNPLKNSGQ